MNATDNPTYVVFGANGVTGRQVVEEALSSGALVRAVEHHWQGDEPDRPGLSFHQADVLEDDLSPLVDGASGVISALGVGLSPTTVMDPPPLYTEGAVRIVKAMQAAGVRRLAVISAVFVDEAQPLPSWFRATALTGLKLVYRQMADMERILRVASDIDWTAVRPAWLLDEPKTGDYEVSDGTLPEGIIRTRHGDLADFLVKVMADDTFIGKTPAIGREEDFSHTNPTALLREFG